MKQRLGFSLMEMMIVLLIVAIVAAASAPMINRKMLTSASEKTPWVWTDGKSIAYNLKGSDDVSATIGGVKAPTTKSRLYINSKGVPQITLGSRQNETANIIASSDSIAITNKISSTNMAPGLTVIGIGGEFNQSSGAYNTEIGSYTSTDGSYNTTIGYGASTKGDYTITIGKGGTESKADNKEYLGGIAIGYGVNSYGSSVIVGREASCGKNAQGGATISEAVAVGSSAKTSSNGVSIGARTESGVRAVAIGLRSQAKGNVAIAIGGNNANGATIGAQAKGDSSIAVGNGASAENEGSIAIGKKALISSSSDSIAIGNNAEIANYKGSIAIGNNASIGDFTYSNGNNHSGGNNSIAIGTNAFASGTDAVAIGPGAQALTNDTIVLGKPIGLGTDGAFYPGKKGPTTVYIPGDLVIGGNVTIGSQSNDGKNRVGYLTVTGDIATKNSILAGGNIIGKKYYADADESRKASKILLYSTYDPLTISKDSGRYDNFQYKDYSEWSAWIASPTLSVAGQELSDRRLKDVGKAFVGGLEEIKKLEVFNYSFKKDPTKTPRVGVMAQDLQKIFPDAVIKGEDGFLRIRMEDMFYALVNAVKELATKFDLVEKRIADLEKQNQELKKQNEEIIKQNQVIKKQNEDLEKAFKSLEKRLNKLEK